MEINSPIIRFKDYVKEWKYFPLKDVLKVNSGRDYKHLSVGNIPVYGTGGYMLSVNSALSEQDAVGIGRKGTIDKPQLLKAPFWTVDTLFFMTPRENNNLFFLYTILQKINWKSHDESSGVPSLSKLNIEKINLNLPEVEEQKKIGEFFKNLDDSISIRQQELDILKQTKQGFLQKMFPKEGETVPEVRFGGFNGQWVKQKLGDIGNVTKLAGFEFTNYVKYSDQGNIPTIRGLNVKNGRFIFQDVKYIDGSDFFKLQRSKLKAADIVFTYVGTVGEAAIVPENVEWYLAPNVSRIRTTKVNPDFLLQLLSHPNFKQREIVSRIATSSQPALSMENIRKFLIPTPSLEEQIKIGEFFRQLDQTIELHEKELEALKETKKAFLQKMFV